MFTHILVPLDGSPHSEKALAPALELARLCQARVTLLRAFQVPGLARHERPEYDRATEQRIVSDYLGEVAHELNVEVGTEVVEGHAAVAILEAVERLGADLVVMCTHGRTGLGRWVIGSVAEKVMRHAVCKVMLVRP